MLGVKVKIIAYVDNSQPGWVRCVLTDLYNKEWYFTEKVPIVTTNYLDENTEYPQNGIINCIVTSDKTENNYVEIDTSIPYGVYTEDGITNFTILRTQLIDE